MGCPALLSVLGPGYGPEFDNDPPLFIMGCHGKKMLECDWLIHGAELPAVMASRHVHTADGTAPAVPGVAAFPLVLVVRSLQGANV